MVSLVAIILVAATLLQIVAAVLAVRALPHSGSFRFLWVALSLALVLMVQRRVAPLVKLGEGVVDVTDAVIAFVISALLAFSLFGLSRLLLAIRSSQDQLTRLATTDPLTGLANRRYLLAELDREWQRIARTRQPLSVLMVDLDHFKAINDRYGHSAGDEVLVALASRCKRRLRTIDLCGRVGGEEFVVLLPETGADGAMATAERLRAEVGSTPIATAGGSVRVTISIGVAVHDPRAVPTGPAPDEAVERPAQELLQRADRALYRAKAEGRNRVHRDRPREAEAVASA
jgi:diguanylate cyclase (GGDEF)-like protein